MAIHNILETTSNDADDADKIRRLGYVGLMAIGKNPHSMHK
jgi:hypothetical protein